MIEASNYLQHQQEDTVVVTVCPVDVSALIERVLPIMHGNLVTSKKF